MSPSALWWRLTEWKPLIIWLGLLMLVGLYGSFLTADILTADSDNTYSKHAKYAAVLICLLLVLALGKDAHDGLDRTLLQLAFVVIAVADFVLGIIGAFLPGLALFLLAQLLLLVRHLRGFRLVMAELVSGLFFLFLLLLICLAMAPGLRAAGMLVPAIVYGFFLFAGLWSAERVRARGFFSPAYGRVILVAMFLFVLCDINVALFNALEENGRALLTGYVPMAAFPVAEVMELRSRSVSITAAVPFSLRQILGILVWFFYLPCLVLLAMSGYRGRFLVEVVPVHRASAIENAGQEGTLP